MTSKRRFTLVELIAAMSIVAVLMGLLVGGATYATRKGAESKTISQLEQMKIALELCRQDRGYYPQQTNAAALDFSALTGGFTYLSTGRSYLEGYDASKQYKDAWGISFYYQCPGTMNEESYDLWSTGRDKAHGVRGKNDDGAGGTDDFGDAQTPKADNSDDVANWKRNN